MAFITEYNARSIVMRLDKNEIDISGESVYKKPIYFLSRKEERHLIVYKLLLKDFEHLINEYYRGVSAPEDRYVWVYKQSAPAYHDESTCDLLHSDYENFKVPREIRDKGKEQVVVFREWFKENRELFRKDEKLFVKRLNNRFGTKVRPSQVRYSNSGVEEKKNYDLRELEDEIDGILREAGKFYRQNPDQQNIIRRFGGLTFLAHVDDPIRINDTYMSDDELKEFLEEYNEKFKLPTKNLLNEYYRVRHNPEMSFEGQVLDQIGFQPCPECGL